MKNLLLKLSIVSAIVGILFSCTEDENDTASANQVPQSFSLTSVANNATDINISPALTWEISVDPDEDPVTYNVYLDQNEKPNTLVGENITNTRFRVANPLKENSTYYWRVTAKDDKGGVTSSEQIFSFTTSGNKAPEIFDLISVANEATDVSLFPAFIWEKAIDPDDDPVSYDIYLDENTNPSTLITESLNETEWKLIKPLNGSTTYYWKIVAKDNKGGTTDSNQTFSFTTEVNEAPGSFNLTSVANNTSNIALMPALTWETSTDPDGDAVNYDVYLDENTEPNTLIAENLSKTAFEITTSLNENTTYYWRVTAKDGKGGKTNSEYTFTFTTKANEAPSAFNLIGVANNTMNVDVKPTLNWQASIDPEGETVNYDVYLDKSAEPTTLIAENLTGTQLEIDSRLNLAASYYWRVVAKDNNGKETRSQSTFAFTTRKIRPETAVTNTAAYYRRQAHQSVVFGGKLWILGGASNQFLDDAWSTTDGINWTEETRSNTAISYGKRDNHAAVVFNNKIWIIAGRGLTGTQTDRRNDVWSSPNGRNWTKETSAANFSIRQNTSAVVFNNRIWIIGGINNEEGKLGDIWSSSDGVNWTQESANAAFGTRYKAAITVFQNKLWLTGGGVNGDRSIWSSTDGRNWTQELMNPPFTDDNNKLFVLENKLWAFGGSTGTGSHRNNLWSSPDGIHWTQETSPAPFPPRVNFASAVYNNKIWVLGGFFNTQSNRDVWALD